MTKTDKPDSAKVDALSMPRVLVTAPFVGICHMQVCAVEDATDEEILFACNSKSPSGTSNGWAEVVRDSDPVENMRPKACSQEPGRVHFLVAC